MASGEQVVQNVFRASAVAKYVGRTVAVEAVRAIGSFGLPLDRMIAKGTKFDDLSKCALVMEDYPTAWGSADDTWVKKISRLNFESFPEKVSESYACKGYTPHGEKNMPQPLYATYTGGDWGSFDLELLFIAGNDPITQAAAANVAASKWDAESTDEILKIMESKVRWCQALAFPLRMSTVGNNGGKLAGRLQQAAAGAQYALPGDVSTWATGGSVDKFFSALGQNPFPPIVLIQFGDWWTQRGYVTSVSVDWQSPWEPSTCRPYRASVKLSFQPIKAGYPTWYSVCAQGSESLAYWPDSVQEVVPPSPPAVSTNTSPIAAEQYVQFGAGSNMWP